jgi:hypothetical protein
MTWTGALRDGGVSSKLTACHQDLRLSGVNCLPDDGQGTPTWREARVEGCTSGEWGLGTKLMGQGRAENDCDHCTVHEIYLSSKI